MLSYDPKTGEFRWLDGDWPANIRARYLGRVAGGVRSDGYKFIRINKQVYYAHRVAWAWMTGEWPVLGIDHADNNPSNNAWANLRLATQTQNNQNMGRSRANRSGTRGVSLYAQTNRWRARIKVNGREVALGYFANKAEAIAARREAVKRYHGEFGHL